MYRCPGFCDRPACCLVLQAPLMASSSRVCTRDRGLYQDRCHKACAVRANKCAKMQAVEDTGRHWQSPLQWHLRHRNPCAPNRTCLCARVHMNVAVTSLTNAVKAQVKFVRSSRKLRKAQHCHHTVIASKGCPNRQCVHRSRSQPM